MFETNSTFQLVPNVKQDRFDVLANQTWAEAYLWFFIKFNTGACDRGNEVIYEKPNMKQERFRFGTSLFLIDPL